MLFHNTTHDAPLNEREDSHFSQAVLDALPHPVLIKDRNGHYLRCNRELEQWLGLEKEQVLGRTLREIAPDEYLGISLAIDDFGTGYSSLSYLKHFPIDRIKVAQEFVREIPASVEHLEIIRAIAAMARSLKLNVIAEGVETPEQLELITEMGMNDIQGFHFSRPLPAEDILPFVRRSASRGVAPPT